MTAAESPRERLLHAARELFCRYGINTIGVDRIVDQAGTAKTTLYKAFGSKERLVEAVLEAEGEEWRNWFIGEVERLPGSAADRLMGLFDVLKTWFSSAQFYGCPFINAVGEHDKNDDRMRRLALRHKGVVLACVGDLAAEVAADASQELTNEIALLIDGTIVAALITRNPDVADHARRAVEKLIRASAAKPVWRLPRNRRRKISATLSKRPAHA